MTTLNRIEAALGLAAVLALGGCATQGNPPPASTSRPGVVYSVPAQPAGSSYSSFGVVQSVTPVQAEYKGVANTGFGLGTVAGAVIGGVAGHQIGKGKGNTAATVAGTAGGAYVGHQLEKRNQAPESYAVAVRMDNGSYQTVTQATTGGLQAGDRVRIDNGSIQRY